MPQALIFQTLYLIIFFLLHRLIINRESSVTYMHRGIEVNSLLNTRTGWLLNPYTNNVNKNMSGGLVADDFQLTEQQAEVSIIMIDTRPLL